MRLPEPRDARAPTLGMQVVAAKVPRVCIIRAFSTPWTRADQLVHQVALYVGTMNPEIEWTAHTYEGRPWYWHDVVGVSPPPSGVYRWDYSGDSNGQDSNVYRKFVGLLHMPTGWSPAGLDQPGEPLETT